MHEKKRPRPKPDSSAREPREHEPANEIDDAAVERKERVRAEHLQRRPGTE